MGKAQFQVSTDLLEQLMNLPPDTKILGIHTSVDGNADFLVETSGVPDDGKIHLANPTLRWEWRTRTDT